MKIKKSLAAAAALCAALVLALAAGPNVYAAKKTKTVSSKSSSYLGGTYYVYGTDLTINGKAYNKLSKATKKKLVAKKTGTFKHGFEYVSKAYTRASYKSSYITLNDYEVYFRKTGTYTLKFKTYDRSNIRIYFEEEGYDESKDMYYYYMQTENTEKGTSTKGKTKYYWFYDKNDNGYYATADKKSIYASSEEGYGYVPAKLVGNVLQIQPQDYVVTTHTVKVKVVNDDSFVKSIQLGKAYYKSSSAYKDGGYTSTGSSVRFLSGSKGKIKVSMGKNYKLKDIVIQTYDKNGNVVYKLVKNKKSVTFGKYAYQYSNSYSYYDGEKATYKSSEMFKTTRVYLFYQDKLSGGYTDITSVKSKKNSDGSYSYTFKWKTKDGDSGKTEKGESSYLPYNYYTSYTFYKK